MKRIFTLLFSLISFGAFSQIYYNFETAAPTTNSYANVTADTVSQGNNNGTTPVRTTTSASSGYAGASGSNNAGAAARVGGFDPLTTYFQTTLTPTAGNSISLSGISFGSRSTGTGPTSISVRTSVDNFLNDQATFTVLANSTYSLVSGSLSVTGIAGTPVIIRLYGFNGAGSPGANTANWRIDDLMFNPSATLPLSMTAFNASYNGKNSQLKWTTANESNLKGFSIEKSLDGISFSEFAFVVANNNANQNNYLLDDNNVNTGANYYRIKMVSNDGSFKYSQVFVINNKLSLQVEVFPNPATNTLTITHSKADAGSVIRLLSIEGKQIKTYVTSVGSVQSAISVSKLTKGNYLLIFEGNGEKTTAKFTKL